MLNPADPIFFEAVFLELFKLVSPYALRDLAIAAFERGDYEPAEDLDWLAGLREAAQFRQRRINTYLAGSHD